MMTQRLRDYIARDIYPFHMPGHKRNPAFLPTDLAGWDVTEIPGMDNLHAPRGMIDALQRRIAARYGAEESFLLVNGASCGIVAAVCAVCADGAEIYTARNTHRAVFNALALSGARPVYILPDYFPDGLAGGVAPGAFARAKAAIITSPTYEGLLPDVAAVAAAVHANGGVLIVDEAHGAHFPFHDAFPASALSQGADIVINSLHKTLPALSQTAVLHVQGPKVDRARLRFFLQTMQTSSPSYILMGQTAFMLDALTPERVDAYVHTLLALRRALPDGAGPMRLTGAERVGRRGVTAFDPGKLLFALRTALTEDDLARVHKIQPEFCAARHLLAMTSPADTSEGFSRLRRAVEAINRAYPLREWADASPLPAPEVTLTPRAAVYRNTKVIPRAAAIGRIAGEIIAPYPPGVPLLAPGERISEALLPFLPEAVSVIN